MTGSEYGGAELSNAIPSYCEVEAALREDEVQHNLRPDATPSTSRSWWGGPRLDPLDEPTAGRARRCGR